MIDALGALIAAIVCGGFFAFHAKTGMCSYRGIVFDRRDDPICFYGIQGLFALVTGMFLLAAILDALGITPK